MASEQLQAVLGLLDSIDLGGLTLRERRAFMEAAGAPPPEGTTIDPVDLGGAPAEWSPPPVSPASVPCCSFTAAPTTWVAGWYLAGQDPRHPYASPVHADLRDLPPILIHVGDAEILLDDSVRFAARARAADVEVTLEVWDDMPHCWHTFAGLLPEADQAIERIGRWLRERTAA